MSGEQTAYDAAQPTPAEVAHARDLWKALQSPLIDPVTLLAAFLRSEREHAAFLVVFPDVEST